MCCGNNSKFKQLSLGKSGNCLEISQEQIGFCFSSFLPSFYRYFDRIFFLIFLLLLLSSKHS